MEKLKRKLPEAHATRKGSSVAANRIGKETKREREVAAAVLCCSFAYTSTAFYYHRKTLVMFFFCVVKEYAIALVV